MQHFVPLEQRDGVSAAVLYHKDCVDGFGAYFAAHRVLRQHYQEVVGLAITYDGVVPEFENESDVYIVDFCFKEGQRGLLEAIARRSARVTVIDHHASGQWLVDAQITNVTVVFDMAYSGAQLSWAFFSNKGHLCDFPWLYNYIADRDLWRNALPNTREVCAVLRMTPKTLDAWERLADSHTNGLAWTCLLVWGANILETLRNVVDDVLHGAVQINTPWGRAGLVMSPRMLASDVCHAYLTQHPDADYVAALAVCHDRLEVSLRSREGGVEVHKLAQRYGGGGHPCAAGFAVELAAQVFTIGSAVIVAQQKLMQPIVTVELVSSKGADRGGA